MIQPAAAALAPLPFELVLDDGEPLETEGFRLAGRSYWPIAPDEHGRLWSEQLGVFFGVWHGVREGRKADWFRLFRADGSLIATAGERAEAAESEVARLRALLAQRDRG